jgi:peptidoglycan-N-acetylglucosamine deacetylase
MKYLHNPPFIIKKLFDNYKWNSDTKKVLLSFDDGPNPSTTEIILRQLDDLSLKAIFFCVGENLEKYTAIAHEIISQGHEIGNHTHNHKRITQLSKTEFKDSISKVQEFAFKTLGYKIKYFRPPHGRFTLNTNRILKEHELINVMWSLLTYDYKNDLNIVKFALAKKMVNNSIVVLHDSNKSKDIIVESIRAVVEEVNKQNYRMGTPTECLRHYS